MTHNLVILFWVKMKESAIFTSPCRASVTIEAICTKGSLDRKKIQITETTLICYIAYGVQN